MVYGNSADLTLLLNSLADDVSDSLLSFGLEVADTWVNSEIEGGISGTVPDMVEKAATYYAYGFILRNLYDTTETEGNSVKWFEDEATQILAAYVAQTATEESEMHPYSGHLTPNHIYIKRNPKTAIDNDNIDNVDDTKWAVEG